MKTGIIAAVNHPVPHLKALIVNILNPGGQGNGCISSFPCPFPLRSTLFANNGCDHHPRAGKTGGAGGAACPPNNWPCQQLSEEKEF